MRHVCVTATSDPLKSTFREREREMPAMCVRIRTQKRSEQFQVCVKMCVISICTTHVKLGSSARLHVARSPNPRAEPTRGASTALSVWLYRCASRTTHHTLCIPRALHLHVLSLSLRLSLSLSCRISPPSAHAPPLQHSHTHTQDTHTPRRSSFPIPFSPPLPSPLYPRADHSSSADGARCGAIGCGCTGTLVCGLVAACIALSCIAIAVTFNT